MKVMKKIEVRAKFSVNLTFLWIFNTARILYAYYDILTKYIHNTTFKKYEVQWWYTSTKKVDDREHSFMGQESQEKRKRKCAKARVHGQIFLDPLENTTQKKLS